MSDSDQWAAEAIRHTDSAGRKEILNQADRRVQATLLVLQTLQQRASQAAVILFAAAAVAAQIVFGQPHSVWGASLAAAGALLFAIGGCISAAALYAVDLSLPWPYPSQWRQASPTADLALKDLEVWSAQYAERALRHLDAVNARRGKLLNIALAIGALAGLMVAAGAIVAAAQVSFHHG